MEGNTSTHRESFGGINHSPHCRRGQLVVDTRPAAQMWVAGRDMSAEDMCRCAPLTPRGQMTLPMQIS